MRTTLGLLLWCATAGWGATYYVDARTGNDTAAGTSEKTAWKTLAKIAATELRAGDRVLLRAGSVWKGQLAPKGSGAAGKPIVIDQYGEGAKPVIDGAGEVEDAVLIRNQEYVWVRNLDVTNHGATSKLRRGVHILLENFGTAHDIRVSSLVVHDVNGDLKHKENGGIIFTTLGDRTPSRFDGLIIEDCEIRRVDRSGIVARSYHARRTHWFPSLHVVIRNNRLDDIGGDAITPWACDGAIVEYNSARLANSRSPDYNAGIWPWSCDNTILRYNEAYLTKGTKDGQGFDSDYNSRNTVFEFNYSHDNDGGFILICDQGKSPKTESMHNDGTIVRQNLSQDDAVRTFHLPGPVTRTRIERNTISVRKGMTVNVVQMSNWEGWPKDTTFTGNVFRIDGVGRYAHESGRHEDGTFDVKPGMGPATGTVFEGNVYLGTHQDRPEDKKALESAKGAGVSGSPLAVLDTPELRSATAEQRHQAWLREIASKAGAKR